MGKQKHIRTGTSQQQRMPAALQKNYFNADELSLEALLCFCTDFAGLLKFYETEKDSGENWSRLFTSDEAVILSLILRVDLSSLEKQFNALLDEGLFRLDDMLSVTFNLAENLNFWYSNIRKLDSESAKIVKTEIAGAISSVLRNCMHDLAHLSSSASAEKIIEGNQPLDFTHFEQIWHIAVPESEITSVDSFSNTDIRWFMRKNFYSFFHTIGYLQKISPELFRNSLSTQDHQPHTGLLIGFLQLYRHAQERINTFTQRHFDLYYNDVLKVVAKKYTAPSVYLVAELSPASEYAHIKAGTEFIAGADANNANILFVADSDILVNKARVSAACNVYFDRDPLISPSCLKKMVTSTCSGTIALPEETIVPDDCRGWSPFGKSKEGANKEAFQSDAPFGFALASPTLYLPEGNRDIALRIRFSEGSYADYLLAVQEMAVSRAGALAELLVNMYKDLFVVKITAPEGWYAIDEYAVSTYELNKDLEPATMELQFSLAVDQPACVPYQADVHCSGFSVSEPIISVELNPQAYMYAYSLCSQLHVEEIWIEIGVSGIADINVYNGNGPLDISGPFFPFGRIPVLGSYCIIGARELQNKTVQELFLDLEWSGLPRNNGGFETYYGEYGLGMDDGAFQASVSYLNGGEWIPEQESEQEHIQLFSSNQSGVLQARKTIHTICADEFSATTNEPTGAHRPYSQTVRSGYVKLTLNAPECAFGHKEYPLLLSEALQNNIRKKRNLPVPKEPYTPVLESIRLHYKASDIFSVSEQNNNPSRTSLLHIHPFGTDVAFPNNGVFPVPLVPQYPADGNLFVGLENVAGNAVVSLFFNIRDDATAEVNTDPPSLAWHYLSGNAWHAFSQTDVLEDSTEGFGKTGIVRLQLPMSIDVENTILPAGKFWICVSANQNLHLAGSIVQITAQVFSATWKENELQKEILSGAIPAGTITQPNVAVPGLMGVCQVAPSHGGRAEESKADLHRGTSERLAHKKRAVAVWDYERLLLEEFSYLSQVRCFRDCSSMCQPHPGWTLVVAIPQTDNPNLAYMPTLCNADLMDIQAFLRKHSSPFAQIEVRNPNYERVQIRCSVMFKSGLGGGFLIQQLNREIVQFMSPWSRANSQPKLGNIVRGNDIVAFIQSRDYISYVTQFSMLKISKDVAVGYSLGDTASDDLEQSTDAQDRERNVLEPSKPWSVLVPASEHYISVCERKDRVHAHITGIDELELGENFIIT